jgi:N-acetylglucosaminyldiphosphoundecaprenol N-acetyl-beta-D-mannosaminyltransferase
VSIDLGAPPRVDVLGVGISCLDLPRAVEAIGRWIGSGDRQYVCVTGMHGVMESQRDPGLLDIHNRSGMTTPDGMPMVWAGRWAGAAIERVYGPDLMEATFARAAEEGWSSYFLGGAPGVADALLAHLAERYPGLKVAGAACPPFRPLSAAEDRALVDEVNAARPDIVWVALGTPKQERWMAEHRPLLDAPVLVGVGAAFDLLAGTLPQAPRWMQRSGFEWAYRLAVEPRRLWRRYLLNIPRFAGGLLRHPPHLVAPPSPGL